MNKTKVKTIYLIIVFVTILCMAFNTYSYADPTDWDYELSKKFEDYKYGQLIALGSTILGAMQTIGVVASVILLMVIGIKYITGSAEEKAGYKKSLMPYLIGAIILFAAPTIANIVYTFSKGF